MRVADYEDYKNITEEKEAVEFDSYEDCDKYFQPNYGDMALDNIESSNSWMSDTQ